jgi:hypothetical protein
MRRPPGADNRVREQYSDWSILGESTKLLIDIYKYQEIVSNKPYHLMDGELVRV